MKNRDTKYWFCELNIPPKISNCEIFNDWKFSFEMQCMPVMYQDIEKITENVNALAFVAALASEDLICRGIVVCCLREISIYS